MVLPDKTTFVEKLHDVLNHLYDYAYLQTHSLVEYSSPETGLSRNQYTRQLIIDGIEQLNPGAQFSPLSVEARSYQVLIRRFVEARSPREVSKELGIAERQLYRDQRTGIEALASVLLDTLANTESLINEPGVLREEVARVTQGREMEPFNLGHLAEEVFVMARWLGKDKGVTVKMIPADRPTIIESNRVLLKQGILQIVGSLFAFERLSTMRFELVEHKSLSGLRVSATADAGHDTQLYAHVAEPIRVAQAIMDPIGGTIETNRKRTHLEIAVLVPVDRPTILIADDNEDTIKLMQRFLADQQLRVVGIGPDDDVPGTVRQLQPAAVVLDLMMPGHDGWEYLQILKASKESPQLSIVVCSVLPQESLAMSLGADAYLRKPFTRQELLSALAQLPNLGMRQ